jgi:GWxTD domain-containing protein
MYRMIGGIILWCSFVLLGQAQNIKVSPRFNFNAVCNRFWQTDTTAFVEIETALDPSRLTFLKDSVEYYAAAEFRVMIQNKADNTYVHAERFIVPVKTRDSSTIVTSKAIVNKMIYVLPLGSYKVMVYGCDSKAYAYRDSLLLDVEILKKPTTAVLSDVELCTNITESTDRTNSFYKNTYCVIPNPDLFYGVSVAPVIFSYAELYNLHKGDIYVLKTEIRDSKNNVLIGRSLRKKYMAPDVVEVGTVNITKIRSGRYKYLLILSDTNNTTLSHAEKSIFIYNSHLPQTDSLNVSTKEVEFAGMSDDELISEFRSSQYVMRSEDTKLFDKLTTKQGRLNFLAAFWTELENGRRGRSDLTRAMYLDRVLVANQRFHVMGKDGWKTDRGRVYVLYAEPDEIQRFPSSENAKPYEIWNYNQIESGVVFVFVDRSGFGDYTLVHSTKRGELQDESWQQRLQ